MAIVVASALALLEHDGIAALLGLMLAVVAISVVSATIYGPGLAAAGPAPLVMRRSMSLSNPTAWCSYELPVGASRRGRGSRGA